MSRRHFLNRFYRDRLCRLHRLNRSRGRSRRLLRGAIARRRRDRFHGRWRRGVSFWLPSRASRLVNRFKSAHAPIVRAALRFRGLGCRSLFHLRGTFVPPRVRLLVFFLFDLTWFVVVPPIVFHGEFRGVRGRKTRIILCRF